MKRLHDPIAVFQCHVAVLFFSTFTDQSTPGRATDKPVGMVMNKSAPSFALSLGWSLHGKYIFGPLLWQSKFINVFSFFSFVQLNPESHGGFMEIGGLP